MTIVRHLVMAADTGTDLGGVVVALTALLSCAATAETRRLF